MLSFLISVGVVIQAGSMSQIAFRTLQPQVSTGCEDKLNLENLNEKKANYPLGCSRKKAVLQEEPLRHDLPKELSHTLGLAKLFVFVSFSLSSETLQALSRDLKRVGGVMVFRGLLEGSFSKTAKRMRELGIEAEIDPTLFRRYKVQRVPTFLIEEHTTGEDVVILNDRLSGNVSLSYALSKFSTFGQVKGVKNMLEELENPL
ncbi:MAG: type-F conjugative transfer system pilin assembly protein TrbC [Alphaproteobacteria bacterium]